MNPTCDNVGMIQVHILDASGEVFEDNKTFFDVGHASDIELAVQIQLVEIALNKKKFRSI